MPLGALVCQPWCDIFENIYDLGIIKHLALLKSANLVDLYETLCYLVCVY